MSVSADVRDQIVLLLVSGIPESKVREAVEKLGVSADEVPAAIAEAHARILTVAAYDREEQFGVSLARLNDLYRRALAIQDTKTALAVQREINSLLALRESQDKAVATSEERRELEAARRHLAPLKLADDEAPLPELCRLVVARIVDLRTPRSNPQENYHARRAT